MSKDNIKPAMVINISDTDETPVERKKYNPNVVGGLLRNREQPPVDLPSTEPDKVSSKPKDISETNVSANITDKNEEQKPTCIRMPASLHLDVSHIALDSETKLTPIINELCYLFMEDEDLRNKILKRIKDKKKKKITN